MKWLVAMTTGALVIFALGGLAFGEEPAAASGEGGTDAAQPVEAAAGVEGFPEATLTLFPMTYDITGPKEKHREFYEAMMGPAGQQYFAVTNALGLLLAEKGYDSYETSDATFRFPDEEDARSDRGAAFGEFVRSQQITTDYALCIDAVLHLENSWQEVYAALLDPQGVVVWEDIEQAGDPDFDKYVRGGPESVCRLVCEQLAPVMRLDELSEKEVSEEAREALRQMRAEQPPSQEEMEAINRRVDVLTSKGSSVPVIVYPSRIQGERTDPEGAAHLAKLLNESQLCRASSREEGPLLEGAGWPNEAKVLMLFANAARDYAREHPTENEYVLFTDYWWNPRGEVHAVHFVICDPAGEWTGLELMNSHHEDFQRIAPATVEDCNRLVVERLKRLKAEREN